LGKLLDFGPQIFWNLELAAWNLQAQRRAFVTNFPKTLQI